MRTSGASTSISWRTITVRATSCSISPMALTASHRRPESARGRRSRFASTSGSSGSSVCLSGWMWGGLVLLERDRFAADTGQSSCPRQDQPRGLSGAGAERLYQQAAGADRQAPGCREATPAGRGRYSDGDAGRHHEFDRGRPAPSIISPHHGREGA